MICYSTHSLFIFYTLHPIFVHLTAIHIINTLIFIIESNHVGGVVWFGMLLLRNETYFLSCCRFFLAEARANQNVNEKMAREWTEEWKKLQKKQNEILSFLLCLLQFPVNFIYKYLRKEGETGTEMRWVRVATEEE